MNNERIIINSRIAKGLPIIRGTQVPVHKILAQLAAGVRPMEIVEQLPGLQMADIRATLEYAATVIEQQTAPKQGTQPLDDKVVSTGSDVELNLRKVLIADDLEDNRKLMQHMFKDSGFTLVLASNGEEALAKARSELPVLVISDVQMPVMSGLDLLSMLRSDEQTRNMGVILVTAHARGSKHASHGLAIGADDYIYRPFMRNEFLSRVGTVMRVKWAEEQTRRQARAIAQHNKGLELVNELALAVNSSLDLQEIFASAMQKLSQLLDAEAVSLLLLDEDRQELEVSISSYAGRRVSVPTAFSFTSEITPNVIKQKAPDIIAGVLDETKLNLGINLTPKTETIKCIPMVSKEQVIGAIAIINKRSGSFADTDWVLLNSAASIVAVALENAKLLESVQAQVDDLIVLNEIGRALTSTLDQEQILKQTTLLVQRALQAEAASLWLIDDMDQEFVLIASSGIGAEVSTGFRLPIYSSLAGYIAQTGEPYISADLSKDEKFFEHVTKVEGYKPNSILAVPVRVKGKIVGVMQAVHRKIGWFDQNHLRLFHSVASSVGIGVENARLFSEVHDFNRQLERKVQVRTKELAEEKEKTDAILASMADGLLVLDAENRILTANAVAEKMLEFELQTLVGQPIQAEQLTDPMWQCVSNMTKSAQLMDTALVDTPISQSDSVRSIQANSAQVRNEVGETIGTVIVLRDITAIKEVERMKSRFMAGITHELKTPLSIIRLHSKNLLAYHDRLPISKRQELLNAIQNQVELLNRLIEDILQLSRLDSGVAKRDWKPIDLEHLIEQVTNDLHPLANAKNIELTYQKSTQEIVIQGEKKQIDRAIRNLVENAIKYTPAKGKVNIQTLLETGNNQRPISIKVSDTGLGIPAEHQPKIFDRFYRVDPSHTIPGTGLGLSIVKEIVTAHGGNINLKSVDGKGCIFTVTLPSHGK